MKVRLDRLKPTDIRLVTWVDVEAPHLLPDYKLLLRTYLYCERMSNTLDSYFSRLFMERYTPSVALWHELFHKYGEDFMPVPELYAVWLMRDGRNRMAHTYLLSPRTILGYKGWLQRRVETYKSMERIPEFKDYKHVIKTMRNSDQGTASD